jgi:actin-related protein 4
VRAGFAGEDLPKSFVNSFYGVQGDKLVFGDDFIHNPLANLEIRNPMSKEGLVEDWDTATRLWECAITSRLTTFKQADPRTNGLNDDAKDIKVEAVEEGEKALEEHPLLMTETAWNSAKNREKSIETAMESWGCPAFWLARNSVLAAFGSGKATALIVDVGASTASVMSIQRSPLAGNWVSSQLRSLFSTVEPKVDLSPHYTIASKTQVDAGAPSQAVYRKFDPEPSESFRALEEERVLTEFKESVVQVWGGPGRLNGTTPSGSTNADYVRSQPGRVFEFPDGANRMWGIERFSASEGLFDAAAALPSLNPADPPVQKSQTITDMLRASINAVDMDLRPTLLQNIVVAGGSSLLNGFNDRLHSDVTALFPGARVKIHAPGLTAERRFGSWIGGSILGSLGTFHQMWISKKEYDEFGASIVEKRCK